MSKIEELQQKVEALLMDRARCEARIAVLTQALAYQARQGQANWAQSVLKQADQAALNVRPEDLAIARVN